MQEQDLFYMRQPEPQRACLLALRSIILQQDAGITAVWKYGMPFFNYRGRMLCYLWVHKKLQQPYIGFVEGNQLHHKLLVQEKRARMKIMLLDVAKDLPLEDIQAVMKSAIALCRISF